MKKKYEHMTYKEKKEVARIDKSKVTEWIAEVKTEAYAAQEDVKQPKSGINDT